VHNHPSGDPAPSEDDIRFTEELVKAGRLMDVGVLDHVIIGSSGHESIRRTGRVAFHAGQSRQWG
jgi:DNA repair protein RadC